MKRVKVIATALALAVLAVLATKATAQQANSLERTIMNFSGSVEMPGVTLEPGTYVFKLADTPTRNVVQVWDKDEKNMIGHWTFVQAERPQVSEDTVVMFRETREGATPAVQFWYFPGEKVGKEFIYPKDQAERIAARTGAKVRTEGGIVEGGAVASVASEKQDVAAAPSPEPAADSALRDAPAPAQPTAAAGSLAGNRQPAAEPEPQPQPEPVAAAPAPAPEPAAPAVEESRVAANQAPAPRPVGTAGQAQAPAAELPRTASPLALSGLLGLLSLAGAAGIRMFRS